MSPAEHSGEGSWKWVIIHLRVEGFSLGESIIRLDDITCNPVVTAVTL